MFGHILETIATHLPGVSGLAGGVVAHVGTKAVQLYHERKQAQLSDTAQAANVQASSYGALTPSLIVHAAFTVLMVALTVWAYEADVDGGLRKALTEWTGMLVAWMAGRLLTK